MKTTLLRLVLLLLKKDTLSQRSLSPTFHRNNQLITEGISNVIKLTVFGFVGIVVIVILLIVVRRKGKNSKL